MKKFSLRLLIAGISLLCCLAPGTHLTAVCSCDPPADCPAQPFLPQGCLTPLLNEYILRFSVVGERGAMTFIGNTLGLGKASCLNQPGTLGAIGAFTTTDPLNMVGAYPSLAAGLGSPAGTTIDWTQNGSSAVLNLPAGITILYAELIWSGSYGFYCSDPAMGNPIGVDPDCVLSFANGPISFTTADNQVHMVMADPVTARISQNPAPDVQPFYCAGNYTRSANVTSLFMAPTLSNPNGTYTVRGVPATVSALDETHNAAGWTLAIVYRDPTSANINNMTLFVGAQQGSRGGIELPAEVSGFCTPPLQAQQNARLLVSAVEGDAAITGDNMQFGPTIATLTNLSGPNNPIDRFFSSQINDDLGNQINTTGTFCTFNQDALTGTNVNGGRQGYDITNVDASAAMVPNQNTAFARGFTTGDDFMINALGIQINVDAPVIVPIKRVNGQQSIQVQLGETVTFSIVINNTGDAAADNVVFRDVLAQGLVFVEGTFRVDGIVVPVTQAQIAAGVPLGTIPASPNPGSMVTIDFQVTVFSIPAMGNVYLNQASASFEFTACNQVAPFTGINTSNAVMITVPNPPLPPTTDFIATIKKCSFMNRTRYLFSATWNPFPINTVTGYLIFKNGELVATVPASGPYVFEAYINSRSEANQFTIVAQFVHNAQSPPLGVGISDE